MIKMLISEKKPDLSSLYKNKQTAILLRLFIVLVNEEVAIFFTTFTCFARIENRLNFPGKTSAARILGTRNQCSAMEAMIINCKWGLWSRLRENGPFYRCYPWKGFIPRSLAYLDKLNRKYSCKSLEC